MRTAVLLSLSGVLALLAGCASKNVAISAPPTSDELPNLSRLERRLPVRVDVEGRSHYEARTQLVPDIREPELTPEEREIMGKQEIVLRQLPYALANKPVESHVAPWYNDLRTGAQGYGGCDVGLISTDLSVGVAGWAGVRYDTHGWGGTNVAVYGTAGATVHAYGAAGARVGYGSECHIAKSYDPGN